MRDTHVDASIALAGDEQVVVEVFGELGIPQMERLDRVLRLLHVIGAEARIIEGERIAHASWRLQV